MFWIQSCSLGALLCQEVAATLRADYGMTPAHIYLSGESPPQSRTPERRPKRNYRDMNEADIKKEVRSLECLPFNILTNEELLKIYLPALRADLTLTDQLVYDVPCRLTQDPLTCALTVFQAIEDKQFDIEGWTSLVSGPCTVKQFVGAHFYLKDPHNEKLICDIVSTDVSAFLTSD